MRGGAKKKKKDGEPATEENRSERQTFIRGGGCFPLQASCVCCLSLPSLSRASATSTRRQNKTKEKKKSSTLPFLFKTKHAAGAHGRRLKCGTVILIEFLGLLFSPSFSASLGCPGNLQIGFYSASHPVEVRGRGGSER